jgi:hypothetical protein
MQCIKDNGGTATEQAIMEWMSKNGTEEERTKQYLRTMKNEGTLICPKDGKYKVM